MSHFTEGVLQAYLDDEVAADTRAQVATHVGGCGACAARLQELRELGAIFSSALQVADVAAIPAGVLAELQMRAGREAWASRWARSRSALARAAMLVLGITAATAVGAQVWKAFIADQEPAASVETPAPVVEAPTPVLMGITVPDAGSVRIVLQSPASDARVRVQLVDGNKASVEGTGKFRTAPGRIEISGSTGELRIQLPRAVAAASVEVDGRVYVTKQGDELRFLGQSAETIGAELVFRPGR